MKSILALAVLVMVSTLLHPVIGALLIGAEKCLRKFDNLPRVARWILCLPLSLAFTMVVSVGLSLATWWWMPHFLMYIIAPPLCRAVFLSCVYATVPRGKFAVALTFVILRSFWLVVSIIAGVAPLLGIVEDVTLDGDFWAQTLGEIAVLWVSVGLLREFRKIDRERHSFGYAKEGVYTSEVPVNRANIAHGVDDARDEVMARV